MQLLRKRLDRRQRKHSLRRRSGWLRWQQRLAVRLVLELLQCWFRVGRRCGRHRRVCEVHHHRELLQHRFRDWNQSCRRHLRPAAEQRKYRALLQHRRHFGLRHRKRHRRLPLRLIHHQNMRLCHAHIRRGHGHSRERKLRAVGRPRLPS